MGLPYGYPGNGLGTRALPPGAFGDFATFREYIRIQL